MSDLSSVLDRIDSVKQVSSSINVDSQSKRQKVEENGVKNGVKVAEESSFKPNDGSDNTEDGKSVTTVQAPVWYEFIDASSGSSYYHNYITNETSWDKPDNFVPYTPPAVVPLATSSLPYYPIPAETSYTDYSAVAYFNQNDGRFGGVGHSHWEQVITLILSLKPLNETLFSIIERITNRSIGETVVKVYRSQ